MKKITVKKVTKAKDGGFVVVFQSGNSEYTACFPPSFIDESERIIDARFITWGTREGPFALINYTIPPVLVLSGLLDQIEPKLAALH